MMKFKKFLAAAMTGAMMFGMVATAAPAVSTYAETNVKFETPETMIFHTDNTNQTVSSGSAIGKSVYEKMEITVTTDDPLVTVNFWKDVTKKETAKPSIYTYTAKDGKVIIDLGGFYKPGKTDAYLECYNSKGDLITKYTLAKGTDKLKIKVNKTATDGAAALGIDATKLANYSYRSLYGTEWNSLQEFVDNFAAVRVAGTTIVVRQNATDKGPASAETKVKISGMAKAPTLKITYDKDLIKVKNMELAVMEGTNGFRAKGEEAFKKQDNDLKFEDLLKFAKETCGMANADSEEKITIVVRTNKNGKVSMPSVKTLTTPKKLDSASNGAWVVGASVTTTASAITVDNATKEGKVKFTVSDTNLKFEYSLNGDAAKPSWKVVDTTKEVAATATIWVRLKGTAEKGETKGEFPSEGVKLTIPPRPTPAE